jgi:hypothetical protein
MTQSTPPLPWILDLDDPRAPSDEQWDAMSEEERRRVAAALPSEFPPDEAHPPEGDFHREAKNRAAEALSSFFARVGRRVYVSSELPVYYPGERMFAPDVLAVVDVEPHKRSSWLVRLEGKGIDFALEIIASGERAKDLKSNVIRYAELGIDEYFVLDLHRELLHGWRLPAPGSRAYQRIVPQGGGWPSRVLGLELSMDGGKLRFRYGQAPLPDAEELIERLERAVAEQTEKRTEEARLLREALEEEIRLRAEEARLRAEEARLRAEEARLRAEAEERAADAHVQRQAAEEQLLEALAEIARLRERLQGQK